MEPVRELWPQDEEKLRAAFARGPLGDTVEKLAQRVISGESTLWRHEGLLIETCVQDHPKGRELHISLLVGEGFSIPWFTEWTETQARLAGCDFIGMMSHRKAWSRLLKDIAEPVATYWVRKL